MRTVESSTAVAFQLPARTLVDCRGTTPYLAAIVRSVQMAERRVLVVEDDSEIRSSLAEVLGDDGITVDTAADGAEALGMLRNPSRPKPSLILLDIMMPGMSGYAFRDEQLKDPALAQIPVVVLSADGHVAQKAARARVAEYLKKPVDLDILFRLTAKYCGSGDS